MEKLAPAEITTLLLGFALMLGLARLFGEIFNRFKQPAIVGEIIAGILLGPTVFGALAPEFFRSIFPISGPIALAYHTVITLAVVLLLLIAGLEIDLSILWRQGRAALFVSILGTFVPFAIGFGAAFAAPDFWAIPANADLLTFALFFGTALSISSLPVIAKIMMDLNLFKTDVGMLVMGAAMFSDLFGWIVFSIVLGMMNAMTPDVEVDGHARLSIGATIGLTFALVIFTLTLGRWAVNRSLPWIQSRLSWPGGVLSFTLVLTLVGAAVTEFIGIHAIFGAFLVGVAVGDSTHMRSQTRTVLHQFVTYIFAPIFFVAIGLEADFLAHFNLPMILGVLLIAYPAKLTGCMLGARFGKLSKKDSWAISFGMSTWGAMGIILGLIALEFGVIGEDMFVAVVVLGVLSSILSGPLMKRFVTQAKEWRLEDLISTRVFVPELVGETRETAIRELVIPAAEVAGLDPDYVARAVLAREEIMGTSLGEEIAVPHARLDTISEPILVVGHSKKGIDFDSPDGRPTRLIFLLLTPHDEMSAQIQIMAQIARLFKNEEARATVYQSDSVEMLRALIKTEGSALPVH